MSSKYFEQVLACPSLPTLPTIAVQLLELTRKPDVKMSDISKLVKSDLGLSAKVLKTINSSFFSLKQPCLTIDRAMAYLGLNTIKSLVLGFSIVDCTRGVNEGAGLDLNEYWRYSIYAAAAARNVAETTGAADPDEAFTAAMFQDMGLLASFVALGQPYADVLMSAPEHDMLPYQETKQLGFTHAAVGAELARKWRLQDAVVESITWHHDPEGAGPKYKQLVRCVALGRAIAQCVVAKEPGPHVGALFRCANDWFGKSKEDVGVLMERVSDVAGELGRMFEKDVSPAPDIGNLLASANEALAEAQLASQVEAEQLREQKQELVQKTITDALTGAFNRNHFNAQLAKLFEECKAAGRPMGVLFSDADKFKSVNDTFGHPAGDAVLIELSRRVRDTVGEAGVVCRYGGEEFAVLLPGLGVESAAEVGERVRAAVEATPFDLSKVPGAPATHKVTVSVGVSATDRTDQMPGDGAEVVHEADQAVYVAKKEGRNRVRVFDPDHKVVEAPAPAIAAAPTPAPTPAPAAAPMAGVPLANQPPASQPAAPRPAAPAPAASGGTIAGSVGSTPRFVVLLVEDDPLAAALLSATLRKQEQAEVIWVRSMGECLLRLEYAAGAGTPPSVILTDLGLPDGSGVEVIRAARARRELARVHIVAMSASDALHERQAALAAGATGFFTKREMVQQLSAWVKRLAEGSRAAA